MSFVDKTFLKLLI